MGIALGATRVNGLFVGGNTVSKASMGADSNKIWPAEIVYEGSGSGACYEEIIVPSGCSTLDYYISINSSDGLQIILENNGTYIEDLYIMSGEISNTIAISLGTLIFQINTLDSGVDWNYRFVLR